MVPSSTKKLRRLGLQSVEGAEFSLITNGQFEYKYIEGDHVAKIAHDWCYDQEKPQWTSRVPFASEIWYSRHMYMVVFLSKLKQWEPPHDSEEITAEKRAIIERHIREALKLLTKRFEIV